MNQPIAVAYSKEDIQRMAEPAVARAKLSARNRSLATMLGGLVLVFFSVRDGWLSDASTPTWIAITESFAVFCTIPAAFVRHYTLRNLDQLPALIKHGAVVPARLADARSFGNTQRVSVTWNEGGKPRKGHFEVRGALGYVQRDTSALIGRSKYVAVVINERVFVGQR